LGIKLYSENSEDTLPLTNSINITDGTFYRPELNRILTFDSQDHQWMESYPDKSDSTGHNFWILKRVKDK
jgi:hypothetical protein